jgi:hypothetical protein
LGHQRSAAFTVTPTRKLGNRQVHDFLCNFGRDFYRQAGNSSDGKFSRAVEPQIFTVRFTVKLESTPFFRMERSREEILGRVNGLGCIFQAVDHVSPIVDGDT